MKIQKNIPLAPLTTFKIGGPAKYFVEINSEEELKEALRYAQKNELAIFVLGGGSNILVSDEGFNGLVIRMLKAKCKVLKNEIVCDSGLALSKVVRIAKDNSLAGLEWAVGIPGSMGGALRGNAGAYGKDMSRIVKSVKTLDLNDLKIKNYDLKDCVFTYRSSIFKNHPSLIILSSVLSLERGNKSEINKRMKMIIQKRKEKLTKEFSAGSFFQNPTVKNLEIVSRFEHDNGVKFHNNKIPAGWLIEEVGLRGKKIGGAKVSEKHANFIINTGKAKAQDVVILASLIKMKVRNEKGIQLKEEIQYVGF